MTTGLSYLLAARRCEIDELGQLARTSALVGSIARLVHALQRERGLSNVLLSSQGRRYAQQRLAQVGACLQLEHAVRAGFAQLEQQRHHNGARLFSRIAWVLPGLDALPALRRRIAALELGADEATAAFVKLIAGLLAVVFEAADGANDPAISRLLAAMFNFMQAKEFAGQERACGAGAFALGQIDAARQRQWLQLIAAQERCFQVFVDFAGPALRALWASSQPAAELADLERLRRIACVAVAAISPAFGPAFGPSVGSSFGAAVGASIGASISPSTGSGFSPAPGTSLHPASGAAPTGGPTAKPTGATAAATAGTLLDAELSTVWFDCCSLRLDAMQAVEEQLCADLRTLCLDKIAQATAEAAAQQALLDQMPLTAPSSDAFFLSTGDAAAATPIAYGHQFERSILDMLQEQSRRVQQVSEELETVRAALNERKLVERAKGLLMAHRKLTEADAHKMLRQTAMNQNRRLVDVAESVLQLAEYLPETQAHSA